MTTRENPAQLDCRNPITGPRLLVGGLLLSIAAIFLLLGSELVCGLLTLLPVSPWGIPPLAYAGFKVGLLVLLTLLTIASLVAAAFCLAARSGIRFDRQTSTVTVWWRWLGRKQTTCYDLRSFVGVVLTDKADESVTFFPSYLHFPGKGSIHLVYLTGPPGPRLPVAMVKGSRESAESFADQVMSFLPEITEPAGETSHA